MYNKVMSNEVMYNKVNKKIIFILYDGIKNSVFVSQVLQPLLNRLEQDNNLEITLVSFEKSKPSNELIQKIIPAHNRLHLVICRRLPFFGKLSLRLAVFQLKKLLKIMSCQKIIARGPLAGWVGLKAIKLLLKNKNNKFKINKFTVQARGLCAQEYRYVCEHAKCEFLKRTIRRFIFSSLNNIESAVYKFTNKRGLSFSFFIEAVSPALKDYLIINYKSDSSFVTIAKKDLPKKIEKEDAIKFRGSVRKELGISEDNFVYCYSGSAKPWQGLPEALEYFSCECKKNDRGFLLLLSQDKKEINRLISDFEIPKSKYRLLRAQPDDLNKYLCASDAGLLFRDKDIINWVSRPTKMLEYQAAGLKVIHNNTVAWLEEQN